MFEVNEVVDVFLDMVYGRKHKISLLVQFKERKTK